MAQVQVCKDAAAASELAASKLIESLIAALTKYNSAVWVAAGGSTPAAAYDVIAQRFSKEISWNHVKILMGDERCVSPGDDQSNWKQLANRLLKPVNVPETSLLRPQAELGAETAADRYDAALHSLPELTPGVPRLDHVWLGMGEDGHTLSLFPKHPDAAVSGRRLAVPVHNSPKPPGDRVSLTFTALTGAVDCLILATGGGKRDAVSRALNGDMSLPVAHAVEVIQTAGGRVTWVLDEAAASGLKQRNF